MNAVVTLMRGDIQWHLPSLVWNGTVTHSGRWVQGAQLYIPMCRIFHRCSYGTVQMLYEWRRPITSFQPLLTRISRQDDTQWESNKSIYSKLFILSLSGTVYCWFCLALNSMAWAYQHVYICTSASMYLLVLAHWVLTLYAYTSCHAYLKWGEINSKYHLSCMSGAFIYCQHTTVFQSCHIKVGGREREKEKSTGIQLGVEPGTFYALTIEPLNPWQRSRSKSAYKSQARGLSRLQLSFFLSPSNTLP